MVLRIGSLILIVASCASMLAQGRPSGAGAPLDLGGRDAQLLVRVTYDNDHQVAQHLRVELVSAFGSTVDTRMTDGLGSVTFEHVAYARYKLRVTGLDGSHTETDVFEIDNNGPVHTEFVRLKSAAPPSLQSTGKATVAATDLNVPAKAKKEFDRGNDKLDAKSWAEAKDHFERAIDLYPQYAAAHSRLGLAYANLGEGDKAVAAFQKALKLDEHQVAANAYLAQFYYDNHKFAEAEPYLERGLAAEPANAQILTALANAQLKTGKLDDALANARKVHTIPDHKKFGVAHLIAAEILNSRGQNKEAIEEYKVFLTENPKSPLVARVREVLAKLESPPK